MKSLSTLCVAVAVSLVGSGWSFAQEKAVGKKPTANGEAAGLDQAALDKLFTERMSGVVFSGFFTTVGKDNGAPPQMEKYTISKVTKLKDDYWQFTARVQYGKTDVEVPMILPVKWAGDTPVITLDNITIPKLGTFGARVVVHGDRYAGTWQHGASGGHLWGKLEKAKSDDKAAETTKK